MPCTIAHSAQPDVDLYGGCVYLAHNAHLIRTFPEIRLIDANSIGPQCYEDLGVAETAESSRKASGDLDGFATIREHNRRVRSIAPDVRDGFVFRFPVQGYDLKIGVETVVFFFAGLQQKDSDFSFLFVQRFPDTLAVMRPELSCCSISILGEVHASSFSRSARPVRYDGLGVLQFCKGQSAHAEGTENKIAKTL
ncbi:hypothetical protein KC327_g2797 [Hortaea werneckii]|nr:hypothetical protein KC358_g406 [Hortaea werneckii]KAI6852572.1 hypothetical protein KC350_g750 [Hortaea werneckii]KAI6944965.1 hypothetical protein KC341_g430 [Hortaea werneckii]KAI6950159.1 hypothetical protein KC348_g845 [Hortaea werneckii]KAI6983291.1 hypothetical protein KC321_g171 [Hortaea werneckii]